MKNSKSNLHKLRAIATVGIASLALIIPLAMTGTGNNLNVHADMAHPTSHETNELYKQLYQNPHDEKQQENIDKQDGDGEIRADKNDPDLAYSDYFYGYFTHPDSSDVPFGKKVVAYGLRVRSNVLSHLKKTIEQGVLDGHYNKHDTRYIQRKFHFYPPKRMFVKARKAKRYRWNHRPFYILYKSPEDLLDKFETKHGSSKGFWSCTVKRHNPRYNYGLGYSQLGDGAQLSTKDVNSISKNIYNKAYDDGFITHMIDYNGGTMNTSQAKANKGSINDAKKAIRLFKDYHTSHNAMWRNGFVYGSRGSDNNRRMRKQHKKDMRNKQYRNGYRNGLSLIKFTDPTYPEN